MVESLPYMREGDMDVNPTRHIPTPGSMERDREAGPRALVAIFRGEIAALARETQDPILVTIDTRKLTESDRDVYSLYKQGKLTLPDVERQIHVIESLRGAEDSLKFMEYLKKEIKGSSII